MVEHHLDMVGVVGSIPIVPTIVYMQSLKEILNKLSLCRCVDLEGSIDVVDYFDNQFLPLEFRSVCSFGFFCDQVLTVFVINAAWANRLKYLLPDWIKCLQKKPYFFDLKSIQLKVKKNNLDKAKLNTRKKKVFKRQISQEDLLIWNEARKKIKEFNRNKVS